MASKSDQSNMEVKKTEKELLLELENLKAENKKLKKTKRFGLLWEDKPERFEKDSVNALPILKEKRGKFKNITSKKEEDFNILIEGDNYHSLSVLNYTHSKKVDVIYIDPPYNTGNKDFIYNDYYVDKEDRFRHSKWLSFMEKRLKLSKNLLKNNGVIFISIDDNELAQLKLLCDEIYGENNLIGLFTWVRKKKGSNLSKEFRKITEYVIAYKENDDITLYGQSAYAEKQVPLLNRPNNISILLFEANKIFVGLSIENGVLKKGLFGDGELTVELLNDIKIENSIIVSPFKIKGRFRWSQKTVNEEIENGSIFTASKTFRINVSRYNQADKFKSPSSLLSTGDNIGTNEDATEELRNIFIDRDKLPFDYPKPLSLIKYLIASATKNNKYATILDYMAGTGTTGHAILELNEEDGGNRKFILCTNNENKICEEVTWERMRRISKGYTNMKGEKVKGLDGNLKYLKTDFIKIDKTTDNLRNKMVDSSTEILCLKENTFNLVKDDYEKNKVKIFKNSNKYTAILFDLFYFDNFVNELKKLKDKPVSVYVFSYTKDFSKEEFGDLGIDFTIEAIPEKVLEIYKKIFNF